MSAMNAALGFALALAFALCSCSRGPPKKKGSWIHLPPGFGSARHNLPDAAPPPCILADRDWSAVVLWPRPAGLDAYNAASHGEGVSPILLRLRNENGAFRVPHDTPCEVVEAHPPQGDQVRVLAGEERGKLGWVRPEWHLGK
jgi:hypothetical protein